MTKHVLRLAAISPALIALSGCSYFGIDQYFNQDKVQYESSNTRQNLEVPPDMAPIPQDDRFQVPSRPSVVSMNAEAAREAAANAGKTVTPSSIVATTVTAKVMREGGERWLRVNAPADQLWAVVQDFWPSVGLTILKQDPKTGYMETVWAENKAKLPQDIIRGTLGKVLDFAYSTGERDQYRCRLERTPDGSTDIFITHRSMVEVVSGAQNETTLWQPGPTDTTMEAEMLQRLALRIDAEFNPDAAEPLKAEDVRKDLIQVPAEPKSNIVKSAEGVVEAVELKEPYDRAWRTVGLVIDRMGFELVDRDRVAGYFMVRYLDPKYEATKKSEQGFFSNLFGSDKAVDAPNYRIHLADEGAMTRITVQAGDGNADTTGVAPNILTLLAEQLR